MHKHRGEILEAVIRSSGYSLKALAEKLSISRNTLYNKFKEHDLSYEFIIKVGDLIHYDFTYEYPEIKMTVSVDKNQHAADLWRLEQKYTRLLESHNRLLSFLVRAANDYRLEKVKHEIDHFLKHKP